MSDEKPGKKLTLLGFSVVDISDELLMIEFLMNVESNDLTKNTGAFNSILKNMAQHLGLEDFTVHEKPTGLTYRFKDNDLHPVRKGGKGFKGCRMR